jgi:multidrug efflux system membrane fusion protein
MDPNQTQTLPQTTTTTTAPPPPPPRRPDEHRPKGGKRWIWLLALAALAIVGFYFFHTRQATTKAPNPSATPAARAVPVFTATATKGDVGVYINALGTVTPVYTVTVTSRVDGEIITVNYKEGQMVRKGDVLIEIDPRPYQVLLTEAEGQYAHDSAVLAEARIDRDRYAAALKRNAIAQQQLADQEQVVLQDEGTVKNDQGQIDNAKLQIAYSHITSPIDGRVGLRLVDPGNIVRAASTTGLVVITQISPITVIFSVAEDYLPQIQKQTKTSHPMPVDAFDRDQTTLLASGTLLTLDNQVDPTTGTVKLKAIFPNKDESLFPNQFVNARLQVDTEHDVTLIPTPAVQRNAQGAFVYVIKPGNIAEMRTVTVGTSDGNSIVVKGVSPGEAVAVNGFDKLQDGAKVTISKGQGQHKSSSPNTP